MADDRGLSTQTADILVVDDTIANLQLLTEILSKAGYRVRPADGAQVALESALESVATLGLLVLIRTFLSWSLEVEISGHWPWQPGRE
jgi:CheY-like chemotaxis protein